MHQLKEDNNLDLRQDNFNFHLMLTTSILSQPGSKDISVFGI